MFGVLREVLSRCNSDTLYGKFEVNLGCDDATEYDLGTQALEKANRFMEDYVKYSFDDGEVEFEIEYGNGKFQVFYLNPLSYGDNNA